MSEQRAECPVCGIEGAAFTHKPDGTKWACVRCGKFALAGTVEAILPHKFEENALRRSLMSHALRVMQKTGVDRKVITTLDLPGFWRDEKLPSPRQQADALILWIGDNQTTQLEAAETPVQAIAAHIGLPLSPAGDRFGMSWLHEQVADQRLFQVSSTMKGAPLYSLTMAGWERYAELKRVNRESRTAFMAMTFGEQVLDRLIAESFRTGFELRILTDNQPAGLIDDQLRAAILSARFLIADLTHGNPGAYWEAGFGEGLGIPVIYSCEIGAWERSKTHFDTNHLVTIVWSASDLVGAGNRLAATIRATLRAEAKQTDD
jgi:hypothetical protein